MQFENFGMTPRLPGNNCHKKRILVKLRVVPLQLRGISKHPERLTASNQFVAQQDFVSLWNQSPRGDCEYVSSRYMRSPTELNNLPISLSSMYGTVPV